jgi:nucleoside 2-deoxyribosyltransferase
MSPLRHVPRCHERLAADADGVRESLEKVDRADIFVGILGVRYGHVPDGSSLSITEMEYGHAVARGIPRLMFVIDEKQHPIVLDDVETGPAAEKLKHFKERGRT